MASPNKRLGGPKAGFTLVEILIGMVLALLILGAALGSTIHLLKNQYRSAAYVAMNERARRALELMAEDIRQLNSITSWNSTSFTGTRPNDTNSGTTSITYTYTYDSTAKEGRITRKVGTKAAETLLTGIADAGTTPIFSFFPAGTFDSTTKKLTRTALTAGSTTLVKQIQVRFTSTRKIIGTPQATQQVTSAQFSLRST